MRTTGCGRCLRSLAQIDRGHQGFGLTPPSTSMSHIDLEIVDIALVKAYALVSEVKASASCQELLGAEAQAIAIELEQMRLSRLTHDLMKNTLTAFGMEVLKVIHKMVEVLRPIRVASGD